MIKRKRAKIKQYCLYIRKDKIAELIPIKTDKKNEFLLNSKRIAFIRDEGWIIKTPIKKAKLHNCELYICVQGSGKTLSQEQIEQLVSKDLEKVDLCKENESIIRKAFDTSALAAMFETLKLPIWLALLVFALGLLLGILLDQWYLYSKTHATELIPLLLINKGRENE